MVKEREKNGKFKNIIDFMKRVKKDVINKRQLEKLIQAGAFDSIESDRSKLFNNVTKYEEIHLSCIEKSKKYDWMKTANELESLYQQLV